SGHPGRPELEALYSWLRPQLLVPVHGEMRHMHEQARLGRKCGIPAAVVQGNGDIVRLAPGAPGKLAEVRAGRLVLDGDIIAPADGEAVTMRRRVARDGLVIVVLDGALEPTVEAIGLPLDEDMPSFLEEAAEDVRKAIGALRGKVARDKATVHEAARLTARRAAQRWSGKRPQVRVIMLGIEQ
ncbi:MAG TPA: MBL fold metallo-hydrolase RNA specificity domain-containing protein, partial [Erythrobacter sp.]|nr:MBL fold metallo-hydrolase RNA specificity domain-containing protein [Erythrobacter sp.]